MSTLTVLTFVSSVLWLCQASGLVNEMSQDKNHMKQHLDGVLDTDKMSPSELRFHYFTLHDIDGNEKLDGCELVQSLLHSLAEDYELGFEGRTISDEEFDIMIDPLLQSDDRNFDGLLDYAEFVSASKSRGY